MPSAKAAFLAAALAAAAPMPAVVAAETFPPPPVASYQITCRLDAEKKTVEGTEVLTWKNTTSRPANTLRFHLYLNAFESDGSTCGCGAAPFSSGGTAFGSTTLKLPRWPSTFSTRA